MAETYRTQGEAIKAARVIAKKAKGGQLVIHARDGGIREHETYGITPVQDPPKKSRLAKRIGRAVGKVALKRVEADSHSSRVISSLSDTDVFRTNFQRSAPKQDWKPTA